MAFLALLLALALWQARSLRPPIQSRPLTSIGGLGLQAIIVGLVALLDMYLAAKAGWLWLPFATGVLVCSLGKGGYSDAIAAYINACRAQQWAEAAGVYHAMAGTPVAVTEDDWPALHAAFLSLACYKGFERLFAVVFWFALLGPAAALAYRICQQQAQQGHGYCAKLLWYMEWPAARALGLSFAFTGNFVGCWQRWRQHLGCLNSASAFVIEQSVLGALSVATTETPTCAVTRRELMAMQQLLERSLWFWLGGLAVVTLLS